MARRQKANADFRSLPSPQPIASVDSIVERTARCGPEERAAVVARICGAAVRAGLTAAGAFRTGVGEVTVANSLGVFGYHREATADINTVVMGETSSGHAERVSLDVADIDGDEVAREAIDKALRGANPVALEPGEYPVILEEYAVADLLDFFAYLSFGAQAYQEKRSFMSGRLGEKVMGENVSIWDDGLAPECIPSPFDFEGLPTWVDRGGGRTAAHHGTTRAGRRAATGGRCRPATPGPYRATCSRRDATRRTFRACTGRWVSRFCTRGRPP
jgi:predicted Zn-dependent protease